MKKLIKKKQPIAIKKAPYGFSYTLHPDTFGFKFLAKVQGKMGSNNFIDKKDARLRVAEALGMKENELMEYLMQGVPKKEYKIYQDKDTKIWHFKASQKALTHQKKRFNALGVSVITSINFIQGKKAPKLTAKTQKS